MDFSQTSDPPAPQAPPTADGEDIEITAAMIEAGVIPLLRYHRERNSEEEIVVQVFRAMIRAQVHSP